MYQSIPTVQCTFVPNEKVNFSIHQDEGYLHSLFFCNGHCHNSCISLRSLSFFNGHLHLWVRGARSSIGQVQLQYQFSPAQMVIPISSTYVHNSDSLLMTHLQERKSLPHNVRLHLQPARPESSHRQRSLRRQPCRFHVQLCQHLTGWLG